jgi:hypothetical protein
MRQWIKIFTGIALLALCLLSARAFMLPGPLANGGDAWQTVALGYGGPYGPKNIGEGYRRNIKTLYYSYNVNFLDYFGSNGPVSIDGAYAILNSLTNVDSYSTNLSEFPLETRGENYEASALGLFDLKSVTLGEMMEQMGVGDPIPYIWTLHDRYVPAGAVCPAGVEYLVVQRNYNIVSSALNQVQYSPYVNNVLYTYGIIEDCKPPDAATFVQAADPLADTYSSVGSDNIGFGDYYVGLTLDDMAGLRSLMSTNNVNKETIGNGGLVLTTNIVPVEQLLTTSNLTTLQAAALITAPAALPGLFPGVVVAGSTSTFTAVCTPNVIAYFTNQIGAPYGSPQISVIVTNGTTCVGQQVYSTTFANVITNGNLANNPNIVGGAGITLNYSPNTVTTVVTTSVGTQYGAPYGSPLVTNTTVQTVTLAGTTSGEYFVIPAGQCGWKIIPTPGFPIANVVAITNIIASATNNPVTTNGVTTTNATTGFVTTQSEVTYFTNHTYVVEPIDCLSTAAGTGLYQGIGRVQFVRADFDSLIGQFFQPITNEYTMVTVTNSQPITQYIQRVVTAPDFEFSAADLAPGPAAVPGYATYEYSLTFDQANILPGLAGPGVINSAQPTTFTFNKVGPVYFNTGAENTGESYFTETPNNDIDGFYEAYFLWGSFDGSTNEPVVFPDGTSIANLENEVLVQISVTPTNGVDFTTAPPALANGKTGTPYGPVTFSATDGSQPLIWSWSPVVGETLPPGMTFVSNPDSTATLSGTPTLAGTFDFTVQLTDSINRTVQWNYSITTQ